MHAHERPLIVNNTQDQWSQLPVNTEMIDDDFYGFSPPVK